MAERSRKGRAGLVHALTVSIALALTACGGGGGNNSGGTAVVPTPTPSPTPPPSGFTITQLQSTSVPAAADYEYFMPSASAVAALSPLEGVLQASESAIRTSIVLEQEQRFDPGTSPTRAPAFSATLAFDGGEIIPAERRIQTDRPATGSYWDVILGAGRTWREPDDPAGWSRASLPVSLPSRREGQLRNCVMLFGYSDTEITKGFLQCSQDTSPTGYATGELRAMQSLTIQRGAPALAAQIVAGYRAQGADRLPYRDWSDLPVSNPAAVQATFNGPAVPTTVQSLGAFVVDGTVYAQAPATIRGPYPYPAQMRHGVHSVTKGMTGGLSMFYLAQRYGESVFDARITDYVPELAGAGWTGVTFGNALDMVSGTNGAEDERVVPWLMADTTPQMLQAIANLGDAAPAPGTVYNYATTNYFALSVAMQRYVRQAEGNPTADYWDMVRQDVLRPMGIEGMPLQRSIEAGGAFGEPHLGIGVFPTADEAAKIAMLFAQDGMWEGQQLVSAPRTRAALGKDGWAGYSIPGDSGRWRHGMLVYTFSSASGGCSFEVSSMQGLGGNYVSILESGVIFIRFIDNHEYLLSPMVSAAGQIRANC